jgi:3-phosphoshikimate 1-carboxyvinyltransferase
MWRSTRLRDDAVSKLVSSPVKALSGHVTVPGDKSISHRALMIGASAVGETRIQGLLEGEDVLCTAAALRALGARVEKSGDIWSVRGVGVGGFSPPDDIIDVGNAGTAARLLMGLLATQDLKVHLTGDASLRSRPMNRVIVPLSQMGAAFDANEGGRMPLVLDGASEPIPIEYDVPVPSAQVKSAILLAALNTPGTTTVTEREATRDHTENMLRSFGADIDVAETEDGGRRISVTGFAELTATDVTVPGDPSSAAYPGVAALIVPGSEVTVENVGINPLRAGLFETLREMGADLTYTGERDAAGEPVADITFRHGPLSGVDIPAARAPSMIDEYPIVAVAASVASGETRMRGLAELRVKESDRFKAILDGLSACGVAVQADGDDIVIRGCGGMPEGGAEIAVNLDHRIGMSFLVLGLATQKPVTIDDAAAIGTSFPGFVDLMNGIGTNMSETGT